MSMPGSGPGGASPAIQGPAVQMVNAMVNDAVRLGASDIHIEPRANCLEVRLRVDGVLQLWRELPKDLQDPIEVRIKVLADLDINEKR